MAWSAPAAAGLRRLGAAPDALVAQILTGGKALGAAGAFLAGSRALVDAVVHLGRGFMFTTAVAPAVVGALGVSIEHSWPRRRKPGRS